MKTFFESLFFKITKPALIILAGEEIDLFSEIILHLLSPEIRISVLEPGSKAILNKQALILDPSQARDFKHWLKISRKPVFASNQMTGLSKQAEEIIKSFPEKGLIIFNQDNPTLREVKEKKSFWTLGFGLEKRADLFISDLLAGEQGINFKINYQGHSVPFWLKDIHQKQTLYTVLAAVALSLQFGFNLVQISQKLKSFQFPQQSLEI